MVRNKLVPTVLLILIVSLMTGCESRNERLVNYAQEATQPQVRQNEAIARQSEHAAKHSQELATAAHELVEQDAATRRDLNQAHERIQQQLGEQQADIDQQRQELHAERRRRAESARVRNMQLSDSTQGAHAKADFGSTRSERTDEGQRRDRRDRRTAG
jgi:hypothetical protein